MDLGGQCWTKPRTQISQYIVSDFTIVMSNTIFWVDVLYVKFWAISWVLQWTQHVNLCVKLIIIPSNKYWIEEKDSQQWQCFYSIKVLFVTLLIIAGLLHWLFIFFKPGKSIVEVLRELLVIISLTWETHRNTHTYGHGIVLYPPHTFCSNIHFKKPFSNAVLTRVVSLDMWHW